MTELDQLLDHIGYTHRPQQDRLFELLTGLGKPELKIVETSGARLDDIGTREAYVPAGVIAQAGTGTGKSIAVLAAAAAAYRRTGIQSLIVTPTRVLMDQYMAADVPAAAACFGLDIAELRGRRWYRCDKSFDLLAGLSDTGEDEEPKGCMGQDVGCSEKAWAFANAMADPAELGIKDGAELEDPYVCEYQAAKWAARQAQIVVTNSDFWIINDRTLPNPVFHLEGAVFVDEAHQLEAKLKDYAGRSVRIKELEKYYDTAGRRAARSVEYFRDGNAAVISNDVADKLRACWLRGPYTNDAGKTPDRAAEVHEALGTMLHRFESMSDNCLVWSDGWAIKMDWIDVSLPARELLTRRPFALVSATIPSSMPSALGIPEFPIEDVGHPFEYAKQATLWVSPTNGAFKFAGSKVNFDTRVEQLRTELRKVEGGSLLLFSSFKDLERVYDALKGELIMAGRLILRQNDPLDPRDNKELGAEFKRNGRAVLFGSESFATGFDAPGDALRLVAIWKLPYPGKDPVTEALLKRFYGRYRDMMLTRIVQAAGRLIRTTDDTGRLLIMDSRAEDIVRLNDPMVRHLGEFARS